MAAASLIFKDDNPSYASKCLKHAKELYEFADKYRGSYTQAIPDAAKFYNSWSGYNDELAWGAVWLYRATKNKMYLAKAEQLSNNLGSPEELSWDNKGSGVQILLAAETGKQVYKNRANQFCTRVLTQKPKTQDGEFVR